MTRVWRFALVVVSLAMVAGCERVRQLRLLTMEQEVAIGNEALADVRRELPMVEDAELSAYLTSIGRRLAAQSGGADYPYSFAVVDSAAMNAFALPGGPVLVHRGIFVAATTEAQLAGVVAHEIAHISRRHAAGQMTTSLAAHLGLGFLGAVLGNDLGASAARMAASLMANGITQKFSRDDEREADTEGLRMLTAAGWDARGMSELLDLLRREAGTHPSSVERFFSSHPAPDERVARLREEVSRHPGGRRDSARFQAARHRLQQRPAPPDSRAGAAVPSSDEFEHP